MFTFSKKINMYFYNSIYLFFTTAKHNMISYDKYYFGSCGNLKPTIRAVSLILLSPFP